MTARLTEDMIGRPKLLLAEARVKKAVVILAGTLVGALLASSQAFADSHYMYCFGGGRAATYFSANYPVSEDTKSKTEEPKFAAFVKAKYGTTISAECHRDGTEANSANAKKLEEDSLRSAKGATPFNIVETNWAG